jgi:exosortase
LKQRIPNRFVLFSLWCAAVISVLGLPLCRLLQHSLNHGYSSHVVLLPVIIMVITWFKRSEIFASPTFALSLGARLAVLAMLLFVVRFLFPPASYLSAFLLVLSTLLSLIAGFVATFGIPALKNGIYPFWLGTLMLPLPAVVLDKIVYFLQSASASLSFLMFSAIGIPVLKDGFLMSLPGVTIQIAAECSGINSTIALFIVMILVAHESFGSTWRRVFFILLIIPLSIAKNAIRIVTLTLLASRVDPGFLNGRLHHEGGFVFFLLTFALVYPIWKLLRSTEQPKPSFVDASKVQISVPNPSN